MKTKSKILIHLVYWIYMLNQQFYYFFIDKTYDYFWHDTFITYSLSLINFYIVYFSLDFLFRNKNRALMILLGMGMLIVLTVFRYYAGKIMWLDILKLPMMEGMKEKEIIYISFRITLITSVYAILIKFAIDWFEAQKLRAEMVNQTQASELALLRSQVNPHFLFNTLNNIYSLVYKKSDDAPEAVMKLSSIMRYVLYDANTDMVLLEKEVEYLNSFIELQKLRSHQVDFVEFTVRGDLSGKRIPPMLLIPFVENAFKHGSKNVPHPGIRILLETDPSSIRFEVTNHVKRTGTVQKDKVGGIGLNNIRRRLELLYNGRYSLGVDEQDELYHIKLVLKINDNLV